MIFVFPRRRNDEGFTRIEEGWGRSGTALACCPPPPRSFINNSLQRQNTKNVDPVSFVLDIPLSNPRLVVFLLVLRKEEEEEEERGVNGMGYLGGMTDGMITCCCAIQLCVLLSRSL